MASTRTLLLAFAVVIAVFAVQVRQLGTDPPHPGKPDITKT